MPTAFLQPDRELLRACRESIVLTSNERLRRELIRAYDAHQQHRGRSAWRSANVYSLEGHLARQYAALKSRRPDLPQLLSPEAELLTLQRFAPADAAALSRTALQAWNLVHGWGIPLSETAFAHSENGRVFLDWARRVREHLDASGALTRSELPVFLSRRATEAPPRVVCLGFESVTPAARGYFAGLEDRGTRIEFPAPAITEPRRVARSEFHAPAAELCAAAQWCRGILESSGQPRIGVVIPDLTSRYHQVVRQFSAELEEFSHAGVPSTFDVAAGLSLAEQPVWRAARGVLELCFGGLEAAELKALLSSKYLDLPGPLSLDPELPTRLGLEQLAARFTTQQGWQRLRRLCPDPGEAHPLRVWVERFSALLQAAGWTGAGAHSSQFQAWEQLQTALGRAAAAPAAEHACNPSDALAVLQRTLEARTFAPQTAAAPVQVMGYLETTGLRFTHLWVAGLHDTAWPGPATPNPFIPLATQRRTGIPRIDQQQELDFARGRTAHWLASSPAVVFSHVVDDGEARHRPSPLIESIPLAPAQTLIRHWRPRSHPFLIPRPGCIEMLHDDTGTALPAGRHRGGSGLLRDQAACPFRAWAMHRLGLRQERGPHGFPDALDRGILIHEALHRLLMPVAPADQTPRDPRHLTGTDIDSAADAALAQHYGRFPRPFLERERDRLTALLSTWTEFEKKRADFQVVSLESEGELEVAGLTLQLRLDRIDRIAAGLLIIDYKTGQIQPRGLSAPRLMEPQLPAYAVSHDGVAAVLFARVDAANPGLAGMADEHIDLTPAALEPLPCPGWPELAQRWRSQLEVLAREFGRGHAAVAPAAKDTCQRCHLQSLCRIRNDEPAP